jgi:ribosome maturation factor RimP
VLRLLIDPPDGGVTIDELARIAREFGHLLDAHDTVPGAITSSARRRGESSPHQAGALSAGCGPAVYVQARQAIQGRRRFHGILAAADDTTATVDDTDAGRVVVPLADVERANIEYDFSRPAHAPDHA